MVTRVDFSIAHNFNINLGGTKNTIQLRMDLFNIGNMIDENWGVSQRTVTNAPLVMRAANQGGPVDANGKPIYRLANVGTELISKTTQQTLSSGDVYRIQFGIRYIFN
jgi:hypothetical protein